MDRALIQFLNHGLLPFTGRSQELDRLVGFWRETASSPGLRTLLLVGEAGVGKSRLLDETALRIVRQGGAVVQAKLFPDAATTIAPLLAEAITHARGADGLLRGQIEPTLASVGTAIVRLAGLRPTALILEDLHLLGTESLSDLASLLDRLQDEPISLIVAARPTTIAARGILERVLVDEMELGGLNEEEVGALCQAVLDVAVDEDLVETLRHRTDGNALALRSALRGAIRSGALDVDGTRRTRVDHDAFLAALESNVRLLSEGMVAHLGLEERGDAARLALLGEVVAEESALRVLEGGSSRLHALAFKGILRELTIAPPPLYGISPPGARIWSFTHSLLHRHLLRDAAVDLAGLVWILSQRLPLFASVPFEKIHGHAERGASLDPEVVVEAISQTLDAVERLSETVDWEQALRMLDAAESLWRAMPGVEERPDHDRLEARLLNARILILRTRRPDEVLALIDHFMSLTASFDDRELAAYRIWAIAHAYVPTARKRPREAPALVEEADLLFDKHPELRRSSLYIRYLRQLLLGSRVSSTGFLVRDAEDRLRAFEADEEIPEGLRSEARLAIGQLLLSSASTVEELDDRLRLVRELDQLRGPSAVLYRWYKAEFLYNIARYEEVLSTLAEALPILQEHGLARTTQLARAYSTASRAMLGGSLEEAAAELDLLFADTPAAWKPSLAATLCSIAQNLGLLLGDTAWGTRFYDRYIGLASAVSPLLRIAAAITAGTPARVTVEEIEGRTIPEMEAIVSHLREKRGAEVYAASMRPLLRHPILRTENIWVWHTLLMLVDHLDREQGMGLRELLRDDVADALRRGLPWFDERRLPWQLEALLAREGGELAASERTAWENRVATLHRERREEAGEAREEIRITMLDTITVQRPGEEVRRVRGAQIAAMLGTMVAGAMVERPLDAAEFTAIAIGADRDPESARKAVNFAVFRIREMTAADAVVTGEETPTLNLERVSIDLLDAHRHLQEAMLAMREGMLVRAAPELVAALEIAGGRVPFPTLYDEFFESAREDFETRLRGLVMAISRSLMAAGDDATAESVLSRAFEAMPDDEEVAELLREALVRAGKRAEAVRVQLRASQAAE